MLSPDSCGLVAEDILHVSVLGERLSGEVCCLQLVLEPKFVKRTLLRGFSSTHWTAHLNARVI